MVSYGKSILPCRNFHVVRNQLLGEGANAAAPPAAADGSWMGLWRSQQRREGKAGAFPTAAGADLQVRASQAGMGCAGATGLYWYPNPCELLFSDGLKTN